MTFDFTTDMPITGWPSLITTLNTMMSLQHGNPETATGCHVLVV